MFYSLYRERELKILKTGLPGYLFYRKTYQASTCVTYSIVEIATFQLFYQLKDWMLQKLLIISKSASNESREELNFIQKIQWKQIFISPGSGARGRYTFAVYWY